MLRETGLWSTRTRTRSPDTACACVRARARTSLFSLSGGEEDERGPRSFLILVFVFLIFSTRLSLLPTDCGLALRLNLVRFS